MESEERYISELQEKQKEIYDHYGLNNQLEKLEEECLELVLAIKQRKKLNGEGYIDVIEEMADVLNIIEQVKDNDRYFSNGIDSVKKYKINRELDRISQIYQNKGFEEKSKELDCRFDL